MRVAVVDIGTNSVRLLVADVRDGALAELDRRSRVVRLGEGVDATGRLGEAPQQRAFAVLDEYRAAIEEHGCEVCTAVMTSAVRDAENGAEFAARVRDEYRLDARTLPGEEEARLSFLGATAARDPADEEPLVVVDIGGGSTELIVGHAGHVDFHTSTQVGVVRHSERHLHSDPPTPEELRALAAGVRPKLEGAVPAELRESATAAIAVAGTATQCAAIDLELDPYDPDRVEGHRLSLDKLAKLLDRLATVALEERKKIRGLDPARAPTIVAGVIVLTEVLKAFDLQETQVSERDILWGAALEAAH